MKTTVATVYGALTQSYTFFNRAFKLLANSTLNEKFAVQAGIAPGAGENPFAGYICIGRGGHKNVTGNDNEFYTSSYQHNPSDAALFKHLPFQLRKTDNDLTQAEQARYGLRKQIVLKGINYWAYYLRRIDTSKIDPAPWLNTVAPKPGGGTTTTAVPFVPDANNLNPKPVDLAPQQTLTSSGQFLSVTSIVEVVFTADEVAAVIEACRLIYDNEAYAIISEIGLVTGYDRVVSAAASGNSVIEIKEVIAAQVAAHLVTYHNLPMTNNGFKETLVVGTTEPMLLTAALAA